MSAPTTGSAVFRIRWLDGRHVLSYEVAWRDEPMSLQDSVAEGFLEHGVPPHSPGTVTAVRCSQSR